MREKKLFLKKQTKQTQNSTSKFVFKGPRKLKKANVTKH